MTEHLNHMFGSIPVNSGLLLLTALAVFGLGRAVADALGVRRDGAVVMMLGVNLSALCALAGAGAVLSPRFGGAAALTLLAVPAAWGGWTVWRERAEMIARMRAWDPVAVLMLTVFGVFSLGSALCAPYSWDEQTYQIAVPWRWVGDGAARVYLDNPYSAFPLLPQFSLLPGFRCGGIRFARLFQWALYLGVFSVLYGEFARLVDRKGARTLLAAVLLSPLVLMMNREFYAEPWLVLELLAGVALLRYPLKRGGMVALGVAAGGAAAIKLTGGAIAAVLGGAAAVRNRGRWIWLGAVTGIGFGVLFYLRSWIELGNPFYPFCAAWFGTDQTVAEFHLAMGRANFGPGGMYGVLFGWLIAGFNESWFDFLAGRIFDGVVLGPAWLAVVALAIWGCRRSGAGARNARRLGVMAAVLYLFWGLSSPQTRFLLPVFLLLTIPAARGLCALGTRRGWGMAAVLVLTGVGLQWNAVQHFRHAWRALKLAPATYLRYVMHDEPVTAVWAELAKHSAQKGKVLLFLERRGLYLPCRYEWCTPGLQAKYFTPVPATKEVVRQRLRDSGADWVLVYDSRYNPDAVPDWAPAYVRMGQMFTELVREGKLEIVPTPDTAECVLLRVR